MLCLPQVGAFPLLLSYPCWLSHNLCNWHCSGLAIPSVPSPKENWLPHSDQFPCYAACNPSSGFFLLPPGFYHSRPPRGLPRYPCSICSLEVGKDSLKCSTCSKWVHFSCSSLTRADFRKSARPAPPWVEIALLVLMGTLSLPPTGQRPPASSLQLCPHPHPLHLLA